MRKTSTQIERDVFRIVKSCMNGSIGGGVYRKGMRPKDSDKEDCVVAFLSGMEGQLQSGEVYVHIYVPYTSAGCRSALIPDIARIEQLEVKLTELLMELGNDSEYLFSYRSTPSTVELEDIRQSQLSALITYERYIFI
ncbi:MAG: hypothetical protein NC344_10185 [Bacteroidales bacterium]|nr:hypothetical protein [Bacteroidales bacterium]MCM1148172.1 hypothetical protein [Bacteroidales bacterium]MCM1207101.1 hypothetical protein [Bacillota bacterium]MCM1510853.1 hypothetical protein [Clostridium sp.]